MDIFQKQFGKLQNEIYENARDKGFWEDFHNVLDTQKITFGIATQLALIHSEVSEALEALRKYDMENFEEELADIVIRVMNLSERFGIDLMGQILLKHTLNTQREYKHGGKAF